MRAKEKSIWIYVTNLDSKTNQRMAASVLNSESGILNWTIDSEDIDNVLRIETIILNENYIPSLLEKYDLQCTPMLY